MAKTIPGTFTDVFAPLARRRVASPTTFDGNGGARTVIRDHNWLVSERVKHHVAQWFNALGVSAFTQVIRTVGGPWQDRLEFRITPRRHTIALAIRINADTDGNSGQVRITTPAAATVFTFAAPFAAGTEQAGTVAVTVAVPPTTQVVTVALQAGGTSTFVELRRLQIRDAVIAIGSMP